MSYPLAAARHLLLLLPAAATLFLSAVYSQAEFIFFTLIGILIARVIELLPRQAPGLLAVEILYLAWLGNQYGGLMFLLLYSSLIASFFYVRSPRGLAALVILIGIALGIALENMEPLMTGSAVFSFLTVCALLAAGSLAGRRHSRMNSMHEALNRSHEELHQARQRLELYAAQVEQHAQAEERSRIAKDIHDDLGHRLIRIKMMMEAGMKLLEHDREKAKNLLEQVRQQLEESMDNMRRTVRKLTPATQEGTRRYSLTRLITDAGQSMGIEVQMEIQGLAQPLYPSMEIVLYRNAQEAITNAVRHGGATKVRITLLFSRKSVRMSVANNGDLPSGEAASGLGMLGMKERAGMLGGKIEVECKAQYEVITELPLQFAASPVLERSITE